MTVRELLARMDSTELGEWAAFYRSDPFGEQRADLRMGVLAALQANIHRAKGQKPAKATDFVLFPDSAEPKRQPTATQQSMTKLIQKALDAKTAG